MNLMVAVNHTQPIGDLMAWKKKKPALTPEQQRNSDIFRLRGFYSNAKTLPFDGFELKMILKMVDQSLERLGAETQTTYLAKKGKA